jgi:hypothetical protein
MRRRGPGGKALVACLLSMPAVFLFLFSVEADECSLGVTGLGYPPIKAENAAQARLMARRAAIVDAYRNALAGAGNVDADEKTFYAGLSGFVKGLVIENEEYLEDGGVRIHAKVPTGSVSVSSKRIYRDPRRQGPVPSPVPFNDWYKIIERSVRFQ